MGSTSRFHDPRFAPLNLLYCAKIHCVTILASQVITKNEATAAW